MRTTYRTCDPFRWRSAALLIGIAVCILLLLRQGRAAVGIVMGFALYAANLLLLFEIGRSIFSRSRSPKPVAALSSAGRLLFLAVALTLIALLLGREAVLGACGGLLIAQVNLHVPRAGQEREMDDE